MRAKLSIFRSDTTFLWTSQNETIFRGRKEYVEMKQNMILLNS